MGKKVPWQDARDRSRKWNAGILPAEVEHERTQGGLEVRAPYGAQASSLHYGPQASCLPGGLKVRGPTKSGARQAFRTRSMRPER